ncbi:hypothetical protein JCM10207_007901 [Rhodosporidiobolus poonsookiae]
MSPISDVLLSNLANTFGTLAVAGIVVFQFLEINAKRERERQAAQRAGSSYLPPPSNRPNHTLDLLYLDWVPPFRSNWAYTCTSGVSGMYGQYPTFRFDLVGYPYSASNFTEDKVLLSYGSALSNSTVLAWKIGRQLATGTRFAERVIDSMGNVRYSNPKTVRDVDGAHPLCKVTGEFIIVIVGAITGAALLALLVLWGWRKAKHLAGIVRDRRQAQRVAPLTALELDLNVAREMPGERPEPGAPAEKAAALPRYTV